jgi:hypothetical protein
MNPILFLVSHLGAGYNQLANSLNSHPRISIQNIQGTYSHVSDIELLMSAGHKMMGPAAIYGDCLLYNYQFCHKPLLKWCKFIYLIHQPEESLKEILLLKNGSYTPLNALRYYSFRLRRICEMAKRTPGAVVIRFRDITNDKVEELISDYLKIKGLKISIKEKKSPENQVPYEILSKAEDCYERHLYYLKNLEVRRAF